MAKSISDLKQTISTNPPITILYGVDGVGKTSLGAEWPDTAYIQTNGERPPSDVQLASFGDMETFQDVLESVESLFEPGHDRKTLLLDSLDGMEPLVWAATCKRIGVASIEEAGYGKGYVEADTEWRQYIERISALPKFGIAVVQLAHPEIVRFDSPTTDPYSRYGIKLHKRAASMLRESADIVGFVNYRVSIKEKEVGFKKTVAHGESGGDRQIHLAERAGFVAKNRYSMPDNVPFKKGAGYSALAKYFPAPTGVTTEA